MTIGLGLMAMREAAQAKSLLNEQPHGDIRLSKDIMLKFFVPTSGPITVWTFVQGKKVSTSEFFDKKVFQDFYDGKMKEANNK